MKSLIELISNVDPILSLASGSFDDMNSFRYFSFLEANGIKAKDGKKIKANSGKSF